MGKLVCPWSSPAEPRENQVDAQRALTSTPGSER
jgi:hypothetical protein